MNNLLDAVIAAKLAGGGGGGGGDSGLTEDVKQALLNCFNHVAWTDEHGQDYVNALEAAMYPLSHITAVYTQSGTVYDTDSLDSLKTDLVVTAAYVGGDTETVPAANYTLSGTLTVGTSTITVSYGGKTTTFDVVVSEAPLLPREYQQVEWVSANIQGPNLTAYIDTGFVPTVNSFMRARFASEGVSEGRAYLGVRDASSGSNNAFCVIRFSSTDKIGFMRWGASVQCIDKDTYYHDYELTPSVAKIDNVEYAMSAPVASQTISKPIRIFAWWSGYSWLASNSIRLSYLALGDNGVTLHEFVACYRKADNVIGFYDTVTGVFKTNEGTGAFTKGGDVL